MAFQETKIKLKDLSLWDQNARFPDKYFSKEEKDLIEYFCNKKDFKIFDLAKSIVEDFDLPQIEKILVYYDGENKIVFEGNRRVTAYKLLNNPELAPNKELEKKFFDLKKKIKIDEDFNFDCIVTENKTESFRIIERKHIEGNNEIGWGDQERANHGVRMGNATQKEEFKVAIAKVVKDLDLPEELKESILGPGYVTNFWRILESSVAWKKYGILFKEKGKIEIGHKDFSEYLKVIVWNVFNKKDFSGNKIDSRSLNTNAEKKDYLDSISIEDVKKIYKEIESNEKNDLFGEKTFSSHQTGGVVRKTQKVDGNQKIFGRTLSLRRGTVNNLYIAIDKIYEQNKTDENILPIIGMSLRLILDVAARDYYSSNSKNEQDPAFDQQYKNFLKEAKKEMNKDIVNYLALTSEWLSDKYSLDGIFAKYGHGNIITTRKDVLTISHITGDILEKYFKK